MSKFGELLLREFGPKSKLATSSISTLHAAMSRAAASEGAEQFQCDIAAWRKLFRLCAGEKLASPTAADAVLERSLVKALGLGTREASGAPLLFAVQTYYFIIARQLAAAALGKEFSEHGEPSAARAVRSPFAWIDDAQDAAFRPLVKQLAQHLQQLLSTHLASEPTCEDVLQPLHHGLFPRQVRHRLGEHYTPSWLAECLLDRVGFHGDVGVRLIDPTCGSGTFLMLAVRRLRASRDACKFTKRELASQILRSIVGIDLNPLAAEAAKANYLLAIRDLIEPSAEPVQLPIFCDDSILLSPELLSDAAFREGFDVVVGNPPWVGWETLPDEYRRQTRPLWDKYGLFPHRGMATILGQGKKDLSMLSTYVTADRLLKPAGKLGFIITQSAFKSVGAAQGFRRFALPDETELHVEQVDDLSQLQPFETASTRTSLFVCRKGEATKYPVPYFFWQHENGDGCELAAEPIVADKRTSPWITATHAGLPAVRKLLGESSYHAHEGVNTGGANGVFWLEVLEVTGRGTAFVRNLPAGAKRQVPATTAEIEIDLLYPLLRGREVRKWHAEPRASILLVQDVKLRRGIPVGLFREKFPQAWGYVKSFEALLRERAALKRYFSREKNGQNAEAGPFYSMFDVGEYTLSPWKVVWHRMIAPLEAAVVGAIDGRPILPQETHAFIPCETADEAHYLAGLLNSQAFSAAAAACFQAGGKGFASPQILKYLHLPRFDAAQGAHRRVAQISKRLHEGKNNAGPQELELAAADVWQLGAQEFSSLLELGEILLPTKRQRKRNEK